MNVSGRSSTILDHADGYQDRIISNFKQIELSKDDYEKVTSIGVGNYKRFVLFVVVVFYLGNWMDRFNAPTNYRPCWNVDVFDEPQEALATTCVKVV